MDLLCKGDVWVGCAKNGCGGALKNVVRKKRGTCMLNGFGIARVSEVWCGALGVRASRGSGCSSVLIGSGLLRGIHCGLIGSHTHAHINQHLPFSQPLPHRPDNATATSAAKLKSI